MALIRESAQKPWVSYKHLAYCYYYIPPPLPPRATSVYEAYSLCWPLHNNLFSVDYAIKSGMACYLHCTVVEDPAEDPAVLAAFNQCISHGMVILSLVLKHAKAIKLFFFFQQRKHGLCRHL